MRWDPSLYVCMPGLYKNSTGGLRKRLIHSRNSHKTTVLRVGAANLQIVDQTVDVFLSLRRQGAH